MIADKESTDATAQLDRARASLGQALGQAQDVAASGVDVDKISASLAKAVQNIFTVQSVGVLAPQSQGRINQTMDFLRDTLGMLQDVGDDDPALTRVTSTVARILAMLYPISKTIEEASSRPEVDPLVQTMETESPLPLTMESLPKGEVSQPRLSRAAPDAEAQKRESYHGERRSFHRRIVHVDIGVQSDTNFFTGFIQDISCGGLFIATYDVFAIGTQLNVNFRLPDGPVLSLDAVVRWVREYNEISTDLEPGMGVQFEDLSPSDSEAINQFMTKRPPIFYDD